MKSLSNISDGELAEEFNKGNPDAFGEIYERYWLKLFNHARRMLKNTDLANDAVQDVFTKLLEKRGLFELKDTISTFLYQGIRNVVIDQIRHDKVKSSYLERFKNIDWDVTINTDETIIANELAGLIDREIDLLPEKMRVTFNLSRLENLSYREIATRTETTEGTVKKQIYYALKILRKKLTVLFTFMIG